MFSIPVLDINVTGACNLECSYCFGEVNTRSGMARGTFNQALGFANYIGVSALELCGGEPLLYRDLDWAVDSALSAGFELILRTNGHLISKRRRFIADSFGVVGISLDGDAESNDRMRPYNGRRQMSASRKFELPFQEIANLKSLNPNIRVILASVATAKNVCGIFALGGIILRRRPPLDLWKIYQFVANNFRSLENAEQFAFDTKAFESLQRDIQMLMGKQFPVICRKSDEIDGSCLVLDGNGDVLIGAYRFGNVEVNSFEEICRRLETAAAAAISINKSTTYHPLIARPT